MQSRRNEREWRYIQEFFQSPKGGSMVVAFFVIWALTGFNPWVAFGLGMGAFASAKGYARRRRNREVDELLDMAEDWEEKNDNPQIDETPITPQSLELHKKVIEDAKSDLMQIKAASGVASGDLSLNLQKIVQNAEKIEQDLLREPHKLSEVQRIFTYYIPSTQDLLFARAKAVAANDQTKLTEIDSMMARLAQAYEDFARKMHGEDARSIDIDIKLLDQSLQEDLSYTKR